MFLGEDLLPLLLLAFGGAMLVGNVFAMIRPPAHLQADEDEVEIAKPPFARSLTMATIGLVGVIWASATLFAG